MRNASPAFEAKGLGLSVGGNMPKESESTLGERMQGTPYEVWVNIAQGVLAGRHTLTEEMEYYSKNKIDWDFVKRYIAEHKHEYPNYKE